MKVGELKIWQLSDIMKQHLAWYLDHNTCIGLITAGHIARGDGEWKDKSINDVLTWAGESPRMIRLHANKIMKYDHSKKQQSINSQP